MCEHFGVFMHLLYTRDHAACFTYNPLNLWQTGSSAHPGDTTFIQSVPVPFEVVYLENIGQVCPTEGPAAQK